MYISDIICTKKKLGKVSNTSNFDLASLPPTKECAGFHFLRCYCQIQQWMGNTLSASEWGWEETVNAYLPISGVQKPVPDWSLRLLFCNCRAGTSFTIQWYNMVVKFTFLIAGCGKLCSCRKSGILCSIHCKTCNGVTCTNKDDDILWTDEK